MEKSTLTTTNRIGFRYFPDTLHYRESDLITWLPELKSLGAKWLVLKTPIDRAVPEHFIRGLLAAGIQPILQMHNPLSESTPPAELDTLLQAYASWGVKFVSPFDQPNTQEAWDYEGWVQQKLVSRFLDRFIPLAELIHQAGMQPVFPGLAPGGHFWDTAFLRSALQGIKDRGHTRLLDSLVIGAYAWPGERPLDWGAGGPEAWPEVHPYDTPDGQQDHLGFRIFDWYSQIAKKITEKAPRIILLGTGAQIGGQVDIGEHTRINTEIAAQLSDSELIPAEVLAACFSILSTEVQHPLADQAWYPPEGVPRPITTQFKQIFIQQTIEPEESIEESQPEQPEPTPEFTSGPKQIQHYLLLPHPRWGNPDWFLKVIRPFVKKYTPTCGYSIKEAFFAKRVTIVGGTQVFSENLKAELEKHGAEVIQITGSGTEIATKLAEL